MKRISIVGCFAVVMALALTACNPPEYETIATSATETTIVTEETETEVTETSATETSMTEPIETTTETSEEGSASEITEETEVSVETTSETKATEATKAPANTTKPASGTGNSAAKPTSTPKPTKKPTPIPTDPYIPMNTPTNTPKPTNTPTPSPTPKPAVAAKIQVTYRVSGFDDPEGENNYVNVTVTRTYTCQPNSGTSYHSKNVSGYTIPKADSGDLRAEFNKTYPNGNMVKWATTGKKVVGFVDD